MYKPSLCVLGNRERAKRCNEIMAGCQQRCALASLCLTHGRVHGRHGIMQSSTVFRLMRSLNVFADSDFGMSRHFHAQA